MSSAHATAARTSAAPKAAPPVMRAAAPQPRTVAPPIASLAAIPAGPAVQRQCETCETEDKEPGLQRRLNAAASAASVQRKCAACESEDKEETGIQPRLAVGPVGDRYEMEADSIAAQVMAMRDPDVAATAAGDTVQRACSACSSSKEELRARRDGGDETIAASDAQLTSGGSEMPAATRSFFEGRMGRDLGHVRIHSGSEAQAKNDSISARAFTYKNHVWLGSGESASPSFTMAHELAHVMQQTAPGPVGPQRREASDADAAVQRKDLAFWLPGKTINAKGLHTTMHDRALDEIRAIKPNILTEVPIPGANRFMAEVGAQGRADIYTAEGHPDIKVPGIEEIAGATPAAAPTPGGEESQPTPPASAPAPNISALGDFKPTLMTPMKQGAGKKAKVDHDSRRAPRIDKGQIVDIGSAPTGILIGEMKPHHDLEYRKSGEKQVANYIAGISRVADKVNQVAGAMGANMTWNPNPGTIDTTTLIPPTWDASKPHTDWDIKNLKIRHYQADRAKAGAGSPKAKPQAQTARQADPKGQPIRGRWMMAPDGQHKGVIVYFLAPHPDDFKRALKPRSTSQQFRDLAAKIHKIQMDLITAPKPVVGAVQPLRRPRPVATARAVPPLVARKEVKDNFKAAVWEAERTGAKGGAGTSLLGDYGAAADNATRDDIAEQGAMAEWLDVKPETSGTKYEKPSDSGEIIQDLSTLKSADFWTSIKARPFGILREKFGLFFVKAYEKVVAAGKKIKDKFKGFSEGKILAGKKGTILKAAAKVASVVLPRLAKPFLAKMFDTIIDCGVRGFEAKFHELIKGSAIEQVIDTAEEIKAKVDNLASDAETFFQNLIDNTVGPIARDFEDFVASTKMVMDVASLVKDITQAIRIGSCVAGLVAAPETVGIGAVVGCGAALGDFILSKFGLSPVDHLIGTILSDCNMQNKLGAAMAGLTFIKTLPQQVGAKAIREVKGLLAGSSTLADLGTFKGKTYAQHASELFCDPASMTFKDMGYEPTDCGDTGDYRRSKTGKYDIPETTDGGKKLRLYPDRDPDGPPEGPWMDVEIPPGRTGELAPLQPQQPAAPDAPAAPVSPPPEQPKTPETQAPAPETQAPAPGVQDQAEGRTAPVEAPDSKEEGHIANANPTKITIQIHGGFNPDTKYDGTQLRGAYLVGTASDGTVYGPLLVDIFVHQLIMEKPFWRIRYKFKLADPTKNLVLIDGKTGNRLELYDSGTKTFTSKWLPPSKMPGAGGAVK